MAQGYDRFAAQWYGLAALFRPIQLQNYKVVSDGNPVELELSNKYVVKGIKHEQVIDSKVVILIGADGKIERLEDRWNGKLPEGVVSEVSEINHVALHFDSTLDFRRRCNRGSVCRAQ